MKHKIIVIAAGIAFAATLPAAPALALNARSFVSGHGLDSNACSLAAPCRTFAAAFAATSPGGEIDVLDPAGYGSLTIDHAISIVNDGAGTASVLVPSGGIGITINAGAGDSVSLRGLTIEGGGAGTVGISFLSGGSLTIEDSAIRHVTVSGITFSPNASSQLLVSSTLVADNGQEGIFLSPTGTGAVTAVFNRVEANNNGQDGIHVQGTFSTGTVKATVSDSVATGNGGSGFAGVSIAGRAPTTFMLFRSVSANNNTGFFVSSAIATFRIARSLVTGNSSGYTSFNGGVILSAGDNTIEGNVGSEAALTTYGTK